MNFNKLVTFSLLVSSLTCAVSQAESFDNLIESMLNEVKESSMRMEQMMSGFSKAIEEAWSTPHVSLRVDSSQPVDINYDDENEIIVTIKFPEDGLKDVEAQTNEKRNMLEISIPNEQGSLNIVIDRSSIAFTKEQKIENRSKQEDNKEQISHVSYQSQKFYQTLNAPVLAAKAHLKIKGDDLVITLPREQEIKKLIVEREK